MIDISSNFDKEGTEINKKERVRALIIERNRQIFGKVLEELFSDKKVAEYTEKGRSLVPYLAFFWETYIQ